MLALFKTLLYVGAVLLVGAGAFRRFVAPELARQMRQTLLLGAGLGAALLAAVSLTEVAYTVTTLIRRFDPAFIGDYLLHTRHGHSVLVRLALVVLLVLVWFAGRRCRGVFVVLSVGLLATFSALSHAATMFSFPANLPPILLDLAHYSVAALWGGSVLYAALAPVWNTPSPALEPMLTRVSRIGLGSVIALIGTGLYASFLHLGAPSDLTATRYGNALLAKLALIAVVLLVAALNRWWLLPSLKTPGRARTLGQLMRLEALLLVTVFALTGLLTTRPPPHL